MPAIFPGIQLRLLWHSIAWLPLCPSSIQPASTQLGHLVTTPIPSCPQQDGKIVEMEPSFEVREVKAAEEDFKASAKAGWKLHAAIKLTLQHTINLVHQISNKRDPRNWPTALYVLLILHLIGANLDIHVSWMKPLRIIEKAWREAISDLSRFYYICAQGDQPLSFHRKYHIDEDRRL